MDNAREIRFGWLIDVVNVGRKKEVLFSAGRLTAYRLIPVETTAAS